jgi:hypothetical protein
MPGFRRHQCFCGTPFEANPVSITVGGHVLDPVFCQLCPNCSGKAYPGPTLERIEAILRARRDDPGALRTSVRQ